MNPYDDGFRNSTAAESDATGGTHPSVSRRSIIKGLVGSAFLLAFHLPAQAKRAPQQAGASHGFNSFLAIGEDNVLTVIVAQTEGGQGNSTGITQLIASELGADWSLVRYRFTSERLPEYINPILYKGLVLTAGSSSITGFYKTFRSAAATTREMLVAAAAAQWEVDASSCSVANSHVTHSVSGRQMSFGALARAASKQTVPTQPRLRSLPESTLIGQSLPRLDAPAKCNGSARYGIDADVPGMLFAAVRHGPVRGSRVVQLDDRKAASMPGVRLVMAVPQGVAVVADTYWRAVKALEAVVETYEFGGQTNLSSGELLAALEQALDQPGIPTPGSHGVAAVAMASATMVLEAKFSMPILAHVCMEPVSCTAAVQGDKCEIWLSTKSVTLDAGYAAKALGIDPATVIVHNEYQGGDFGRRSGIEHTTEAVLLSKAVGRPVKVIWTRKEDIRVDQHRTAVLGHARMGLAADGSPVAYEAKVASDGAWRSLLPDWYASMKPLDLPMFSLVGGPYGIAHEAGAYVLVPHPVRIGVHRGNAEVHNGFLLETMIDEAAIAGGQDPLAYRRGLIAKDARGTAVLDRVAALANWSDPMPGRHQGVAYYQSDFYRCRLATVVEVSVSDAGIKLERAFAVCDSGLVINPNLARQCIEGGLIFGLSTSIHEEITLSDGAPAQTNFHDYRVLRFNEAPGIFTEVINVGEEPGAFGEVGIFGVGAALGNAIRKATGKRLYSQPFARDVKFA